MSNDNVLRAQLLKVLNGRNAHFTFDEGVADFPIEAINDKPPNVPYTPWHLIEHLRIAQWDILEFVRNPNHVSPKWPEGYWPDPDSMADSERWQSTLAAFRTDLTAVEAIINDADIELTAEIPHAPGYTYLREVLLVADHNAYHIGELCILRQVMGTW
jgi:hypothetical protein